MNTPLGTAVLEENPEVSACTLCKQAAKIVISGVLRIDLPRLRYFMCESCLRAYGAISSPALLNEWRKELWEQVAIDLGEPPGRGLEWRRKAPAGYVLAAPDEQCTRCDRLIGDECYSRNQFDNGLKYVLCMICDEEIVANSGNPEALAAISREVEQKALLTKHTGGSA